MAKSSPEELSGRTWKIPPKPVPSDECTVYVGRQYGVLKDGAGTPIPDENGNPKRGIIVDGEPYWPHKGETLWLLPVTDMATYLAIVELDRVNRELQGEALVAEQQKAWRDLATKLSEHLAAWDWTDVGGDPLPQPYKNPDVLIGLDSAEFSWIVTVVQEGPPIERKNGSGPSPSTRSGTGQRQRKSSSAGSAEASITPSLVPS